MCDITRTTLLTKNKLNFSRCKGGKTLTFFLVQHGPHNVSRWMTWLPISLKNAAKCDNWYQLQNHSITESLNAKGAREDLFIQAIACMLYLSVDPQYYFSLLMLVEKKWNRVFLLMSMLFSESLKKALVPLTHSKQIELRFELCVWYSMTYCEK